jgi:hypothetical protein
MSGRIFGILGAAMLLVGLSAGAVSAGGWATITADPGNGQPTEGEPYGFGFTVLQHGVTPAGWVEARLVAVSGTTGERVEAEATAQGADGHFVATITLPTAGHWTWHVELSDLVVETAPQALAVAGPNGIVPGVDGAALLTAVERARAEVRTELRDEFYGELDTLRTSLSTLGSQIAALRAERDALRERVDALDGGAPAGIPLVATIAIAALAGAIAGFVMVALGRGSTGAGRVAEEAAVSAGGVRPAGQRG